MKNRIALLGASVLCAFGFLGALQASAAAQTSIQIEQVSPAKVGTWTMLFADGNTRHSTETGVVLGKTSFSITEFGPMTLTVVPQSGMAARVSVYRNGDLAMTVTNNQYSFTPKPNEAYRFVIQYAYSNLGSLGVTSDPSNLRFRMKGPDNKMRTAKSPFTFNNIPAGKYTLYFPALTGCTQPAPHGATVEAERRNTVNITLPCGNGKEETVDTARVSKRTLVEQARSREYKPRGQRK